MIDEKKIELIKKLQRLAERGVGGEKEGAQKKLQQLMKKYDIEESDLSDDKLEDHEWKYHNDFELRLLKQTIYKVLAGFKEHGFMVAAEHMPDTCTKCPFWLTDLEMQYDGMCFLTGEVIPTPERTCDTKVMGNCPIVPLDRLKKKNTRKEKNMSRPTKTCYDCKNAYWDSVPYGSTTATMFGGCDKAEEMTEEEADRFGETEDCPFWENKYKEENA